MKEKHINENEYRIFVISDIHGNHKLLKKLIKKLHMKPEDHLVLLGDYINKGNGGLETLEYVKELDKRERTYVLKGNHESGMYMMFTDKYMFSKMCKWIDVNKKNLVNDILVSEDKKISDFTKDELFDYLNSKTEIIEQIENMLTVLYFDDFIFIHGGYEREMNADEEYKYLKWDTYNEDSGVNEKTVIVGHMPVSNFRDDMIDTKPFFNQGKNIIFIDGGMGVKRVSELNALIIEKRDGNITYDVVQENDFIKKTVLSNTYLTNDKDDVFVHYPNFEVEIIKNDGQFSLCRYLKNNREFRVFTSMLDGDRVTYNYTNNFLSVSEGDTVYVCYYYEDYALVKCNNTFGWIKKESIL